MRPGDKLLYFSKIVYNVDDGYSGLEGHDADLETEQQLSGVDSIAAAAITFLDRCGTTIINNL